MKNIEDIVLNGFGPNINEELARKIGLNETIVLGRIDYWIKHNKKKGINYREGKYWTFNSIKNWHENSFSYWSVPTLVRIFKSLEDKGLLISNKFNKSGFDRTKWYTIDYEKLLYIMDDSYEDNKNNNESILNSNDDSKEKDFENDLKNNTFENKSKEKELNKKLDKESREDKKDDEKESEENRRYDKKDSIENKKEDRKCNRIKELISKISNDDENEFIKNNKREFIKMIKQKNQFDKTYTKEYNKNNTNIYIQPLEHVVAKEKIEVMLKDFLGSAYTNEFLNKIVKLLKEKGEDYVYLQDKINIAKYKNVQSKCGYLYAALKNNYKDFAYNGSIRRNSFMNFEEHDISKYTEEDIMEMNRRKFA